MERTAETDVKVFFNPSCSKCRTVRAILEERGVEAHYVRYLEHAPAREDLEEVLRLLGTDDPGEMMRPGDELFKKLGLATADREELLDAMAKNPALIERPIIIRGDHAIIGRPPERALELFKR